MRLANKLYPYPILWNGNDDYIGSNFDINIKHIINKRSIVFKIEVILDDELLLKLINENVLSYSIIIECGSTCFRKFYKFKNNEYVIEIDGNKLNEKVELHPFIIANQNFEYKDNPNLNKVYEGIEFNIEKYNIMALCNPREIIIEKDEDSLKSIRSIFT